MPAARPNILLITTDQQRGDCLGIEGHPVLETPNMDYLGAFGTHFRRAYSECPHCIPARRTLMTGLAPWRHGMVYNYPSMPLEGLPTLPEGLRAAGYQTEMIGKLHLWPARKRYGFDHLVLADAPHGKNDYTDWLGGAVPIERWPKAHGGTMNGWLGRPTHLTEQETHSFWCVTEAIGFLSKRDPSMPFFLNLSFFDPHPPFTPPPFLFERYDRLPDLPKPFVGDWAPPVEGPRKGWDPELVKHSGQIYLDDRQMHHCRAGYYGAINHVDYQIGRLLEYLRDAKAPDGERLLDHTFIVFASDHGEMLGDQHMFGKTRGFEPAARIPLLALAPPAWEYAQGVEVRAPVGLQDIMPTLLDVAGAPIPESVTGRSVLPLMRGEADDWRDAIHGECADRRHPDPDGPVHYLVDDHQKYLWLSRTGRELLFDLDGDPHELHDLSADPAHARDLERWRRRLIQELAGRPEGFTDGARLIAGRPHGPLSPPKEVDPVFWRR